MSGDRSPFYDPPTLYKIVGPGGEPLNGGHGAWPLPTDTEPGEWRRVEGPVVPCANGLHLTDAAHLRDWMPNYGQPCVVYRAETRGTLIEAGGKWAAQEVRLLPRNRAMPDLAEAENRYRAALTSADGKYERALRGAGPWAAYARTVGPNALRGFPVDHVAHASLAKMVRATDVLQRAKKRAAERYARDVAAVLPE